jgi:peroxiredoxin
MKKSFLYTLVSVWLLAIPLLAQQNQPAGLKTGTQAPVFTGKDYRNNPVSLTALLGKGPVVLLFYRGYWCPHCNKQLSRLQDSLSFVTATGASVVAITPETDENIRKTADKTKATFSIIHDQEGKIMNMYQTNYPVDEDIQKKYKGYGIDFAKTNGTNGAILPVPAVYIIGRDGIIKQVYFDSDYTKRPSVNSIVQALENL